MMSAAEWVLPFYGHIAPMESKEALWRTGFGGGAKSPKLSRLNDGRSSAAPFFVVWR